MEFSSSKSSSPHLNGQPSSFFVPMQPPVAAQPGGDFDLKRFLNMLRRRALVVAGVAGIVMLLTIKTALNQTLAYKGSFNLLVEPINADNSLSNLTPNGSQQNQFGLDYETQIQVLRSPELLTKLRQQLQAAYPGANYQFSPNNLSIIRIERTKLLEVSYQSNDPAEVKAVLDQAVLVYLRYSLAERQTNLRQGIQFIEKQLPSLQERVNALQDELQTFRQRYNFIDPDTQTQQVSSQTRTLDQQQQEVEQKLAQAQFQLSTLQGTNGGIATLKNSQSYQQLVSQLRQIEVQIASELTRLQPQSLTIRVLEEKKQSLLPLLRQEAQRSLGAELANAAIQIQSLEIQRAAILQAQAKAAVQVQQLPILSRNYVDLQRELQIASDSLNRFQTTRETLQIQAAQTEIPWQLVQAPVQPQAPIASNTNRTLLMGVLASVALGVAAAMLLEKLDSSFHTVDDLKAQLKLPVLGAIPTYAPIQEEATPLLERIFHQVSRRFSKRGRSRRHRTTTRTAIAPVASSSFTEALRVFHTNLRLLNSTQPLSSIVITSAVPGDGKSTIAFHLAQTAKAMGQKVLLVDADLRRPRLHQWLNLPEQRGLSDVLSANVPVKEVLIQSSNDPNFCTLTAGSLPADPTQLLASAKMKRLMEQFNQIFDLVIYDTPPLLGLADANLLASQTDGLLLVVRLNRTDRAAVKQAVEGLKVTQASILGVVANGLQHSSFDFYDTYALESTNQNLLTEANAGSNPDEIAPP